MRDGKMLLTRLFCSFGCLLQKESGNCNNGVWRRRVLKRKINKDIVLIS